MTVGLTPHCDSPRVVVESLNREFAQLHDRLLRLLWSTADTLLYTPVAPVSSSTGFSIGESLIRAGRVLEQTFGGLTANLWDDAYEWTLPETLSQAAQIEQYLKEVEDTRTRAFATFSSDEVLRKKISLPSGSIEPLVLLLVTTLAEAATCYGQALAIFRSLSK